MWMCPQANAGMRKADIVSRKLYFALNVHSFMVHFVPKKGKKWMQATRHFGEKGRLEAKVSSLRLIGKKKYVMEDLKSFKFPCTSAQLKSGELETMINGLTLIEEMVNSLETNFNNGQTEKELSMDRILKETKKEKKVTMKEWLTEVTWEYKQ
ncbi:unnamed protein product [Mucor hiemalis]